MAVYDYSIGLTEVGLTSLATLGVTWPLQTFKPFSKAVENGAGGVKGQGWPIAEWVWGFLEEDERDALKALCPGLSVEVYIRTLNADLDWRTYRALMIWPTEAEDRQVGSSMKFQLVFRIKEELAEAP